MTAKLSVNVSTDAPSAVGQIDATDRGLLIPRMTTTQRDAIASPATSLLIFNTTTGAYNFYTGAAWVALGGSAGGAPADATYLLQTANAGLSAEQALSSLATGLMQVTTTTGAVSSVTTSAGLAALISDETGSGALVFATSPTIVTPTIAKLANLTSNGFVTTNSSDGTLAVVAAKQMIGGNPVQTVGIGATNYIGPFGAGINATETATYGLVPFACTARNLYVRTATGQPAGGSLVVTLRKNAADTAVTFTIAASAGAGTYSDLTNSVAFAAGDTLDVKLVNNDGSAVSAGIRVWTLELDTVL